MHYFDVSTFTSKALLHFECMLKRRGNVKIAVIENFDDILGTNKKLDLTNSASSSETHLLLTLR